MVSSEINAHHSSVNNGAIMNTPEAEEYVKRKMERLLADESDPIKRLRLKCLTRGSTGIKGLSRVFRIMDDDNSRSLNVEEMRKGFQDYGLKLEEEEARAAFAKIDKDESGSVSFDEFLNAMRPPMNDKRKKIVNEAFFSMDRSGDGVMTKEDLMKTYNAKEHPKYRSGEWTKEQCLEAFLMSFEAPKNRDGKVTLGEFLDYYSGMSAGIDDDDQFELVIKSAYEL